MVPLYTLYTGSDKDNYRDPAPHSPLSTSKLTCSFMQSRKRTVVFAGLLRSHSRNLEVTHITPLCISERRPTSGDHLRFQSEALCPFQAKSHYFPLKPWVARLPKSNKLTLQDFSLHSQQCTHTAPENIFSQWLEVHK